MGFQFRLFWRVAIRSFQRSARSHSPRTRKRIIFLLLFYAIWTPLALGAWVGFFLDDLLFPAYQRQPVEKPLFILSNFRSGSTFLHRVLARDSATFTTLRTCDVFMMPSITQRRVMGLLARIDALFGRPAEKILRRLDAFSLGRITIHPISLFAPEEDETLLLYRWSTFFVGFMFPFLDELPPYQYFDSELPPAERRAIMAFYRGCVQRHLYATGGRHFVSKNPLFSAKIETLLEVFPDARIVYLVRNPLDMLPSTLSWLSYAWRLFNDPPTRYPYRREILTWAKYWYHHPLNVLDRSPSRHHWILKHEDLVRHPDAILRELYLRFDYPQSSATDALLNSAVAESRNHISTHLYDLREMGFTREQIVQEFSDIFARFDYDPREPATLPPPSSLPLPATQADYSVPK